MRARCSIRDKRCSHQEHVSESTQNKEFSDFWSFLPIETSLNSAQYAESLGAQTTWSRNTWKEFIPTMTSQSLGFFSTKKSHCTLEITFRSSLLMSRQYCCWRSSSKKQKGKRLAQTYGWQRSLSPIGLSGPMTSIPSSDPRCTSQMTLFNKMRPGKLSTTCQPKQLLIISGQWLQGQESQSL